MRKKNLELKTTNNQIDASTQTPIEIALKIDENGMTTASQLYSFLELHPAHFSDWCRRNIKNNKFATKNIDYFPFTVESERNKPKNPNPRTDYKLTSDFAKKLLMTMEIMRAMNNPCNILSDDKIQHIYKHLIENI